MSMKRFSKAALRIAQEMLTRIRIAAPTSYVRLGQKIFPPSYRLDIVVRKIPPTKSPILRMLRIVLRNNRLFFRPFSSLAIHHRHLKNAEKPADLRIIRRFHVPQAKTLEMTKRVRDLFATNDRYNADARKSDVGESLDAYDIGENIGYGCNAAVYALKLKEEQSMPSSSRADPWILSETHKEQKSNDPLKQYPLALKLMYNYELDALSEDHLWRSMGAEVVPLPASVMKIKGRFGNFRQLPSTHPNVIRLLTAFIDRMPILPDARERYPEALPSAPFYELIVREPKTMFIVMRRYRMTLRDYVLTEKRNYWTGRVMFGQLLEGCVFLYDNIVSQRDMKSDNILLEFDHPDEVPHLVISDFGCALANGSWDVPYIRDDDVDLGGNLATRAPEITTSKPGPDSVVNFRLSDTWAAGTIAYEIFTRVNPFYSQMKSATYSEAELPQLPRRVHHAVRSLVPHILTRDPSQRVLPHVAANVVCLSLFRFGGDVRNFLSSCGISSLRPSQLKSFSSRTIKKLGEKAEKALDDVLSLLAAETILARGLAPDIISKAELQLRATFFSRIDRDYLWSSVPYFFMDSIEEARSLSSIGSLSSDLSISPQARSINGILNRISSK